MHVAVLVVAIVITLVSLALAVYALHWVLKVKRRLDAHERALRLSEAPERERKPIRHLRLIPGMAGLATGVGFLEKQAQSHPAGTFALASATAAIGAIAILGQLPTQGQGEPSIALPPDRPPAVSSLVPAPEPSPSIPSPVPSNDTLPMSNAIRPVSGQRETAQTFQAFPTRRVAAQASEPVRTRTSSQRPSPPTEDTTRPTRPRPPTTTTRPPAQEEPDRPGPRTSPCRLVRLDLIQLVHVCI